jgi:AcrR family transcriptional regulator
LTLQPEIGLRERRKRATVAEIREAALGLFEKNGVGATTIGEIARQAVISERTFFRYFGSKEECVLDFYNWFEVPTDEWLIALNAGAPILPQLEAFWARALESVDLPQSEVLSDLLRVRKLMASEPSLRAASLMLDGEFARKTAKQIEKRCAGRVTWRECLLAAEFVGLSLRVACDEWTSQRSNGEPASLARQFAAVRTAMRITVAADSA